MAVENTGRTSKNRERNPDGISCRFCESTNTKWRFFNNKKVGQPRYRCSDCKKLWTEGGEVRGPYAKKRNHHGRNQPEADPTPQPPVPAVDTPTPTVFNESVVGSELGGVPNSSLWNALVEVAKQALETDFPSTSTTSE